MIKWVIQWARDTVVACYQLGEHHAADSADNFDGRRRYTYDVPVKWPSLYCTEWCAPYRKMRDSASVWNVMGVSLLASFLEPVNMHRFGAEHSSLSFTLLIPCLPCLNYPASSISPSGSFFLLHILSS